MSQLRRAGAWAAALCVVLVAVACGLGTAGTGADFDPTLVLADASVHDGTTSSALEGQSPADSDGNIADAGDASNVDRDADASLQATYACAGVSVTSCAIDCPGMPSICRGTGTCVATCASDCPGFRVACFMCNSAGANPVGTCEAENDAGYCMNSDYAPGSACACPNGDAGACLGDYQKCLPNDAGAFACHSCGEEDTMGGPATCKNGKMCDFNGSPTDHLTCH